MSDYRHWRLERDLDGIVWAWLDREGESANALSSAVLDELEHWLGQLEDRPPRGLVILSAKDSGFIAGADVREFDAVHDNLVLAQRIRRVHAMLDRLERLPFPTVAAIRGFCLGGGLELALACSYRIAQDLDSTRLGFPEVQLGIFPGFGGTWRAMRRLGGQKAMELMLSARQLGAKAARAIGLVDEVVGPHASLRWAARRAILNRRRSRGPGWLAKLGNTAPARALLAPVMEKQVAHKARRAHYPAPYALIEHWRAHAGDRERMLSGEAHGVADLLVGDAAKGLRRTFHLMELLKRQGKAEDFAVHRVHVVGAGVMGGDIAAWCALRGLEVTLQDQSLDRIQPALERARGLFGKRLKAPHKVKAAEARLIADPEGKGVCRAEVVIEAIFEDRAAKAALFQRLEPRMKPEAVLASNTSAIPLEELAAVLERPSRLIGLHFFNPVAQMPLVEVVHGAATDAREVARGCAFAARIGKLPLPVKSGPGFLVNRVLAPYLLEAMTVHLEGVPMAVVDEAALAFGMPMGPIELADTVGLDVCLKVAETLAGERGARTREKLGAMVAAGTLGKKSGEGLYRWKDGKPLKPRAEAAGHDLAALGQRLVQPLLDECRACLAEGVVGDAELLDAGVVFGTGFAPFRGGPMAYQGLAGTSAETPSASEAA